MQRGPDHGYNRPHYYVARRASADSDNVVVISRERAMDCEVMFVFFASHDGERLPLVREYWAHAAHVPPIQ